MSNPSKKYRIRRTDGRLVNVIQHRGQLIVCATGCCCGRVEKGFAPVWTNLYHEEWERRNLRNKVHLSQGGCLGPCEIGNLVTLVFDRKIQGFHSIDHPEQIFAIYDYIEALLLADDPSAVNLPAPLEGCTYDYFV